MSRDAHADLLIEIGTEELPPTAQASLAQALADAVRDLLTNHGLAPSRTQSWWGPRRLAVLAGEVPGREPDCEI